MGDKEREKEGRRKREGERGKEKEGRRKREGERGKEREIRGRERERERCPELLFLVLKGMTS